MDSFLLGFSFLGLFWLVLAYFFSHDTIKSAEMSCLSNQPSMNADLTRARVSMNARGRRQEPTVACSPVPGVLPHPGAVLNRLVWLGGAEYES